ncbi:MAG: hypothetical protein ABI277_09685 [Burkholderiaceae bacterium]
MKFFCVDPLDAAEALNKGFMARVAESYWKTACNQPTSLLVMLEQQSGDGCTMHARRFSVCAPSHIDVPGERRLRF